MDAQRIFEDVRWPPNGYPHNNVRMSIDKALTCIKRMIRPKYSSRTNTRQTPLSSYHSPKTCTPAPIRSQQPITYTGDSHIIVDLGVRSQGFKIDRRTRSNNRHFRPKRSWTNNSWKTESSRLRLCRSNSRSTSTRTRRES